MVNEIYSCDLHYDKVKTIASMLIEEQYRNKNFITNSICVVVNDKDCYCCDKDLETKLNKDG